VNRIGHFIIYRPLSPYFRMLVTVWAEISAGCEWWRGRGKIIFHPLQCKDETVPLTWFSGAPGWLSWLRFKPLPSAQVLIPGSEIELLVPLPLPAAPLACAPRLAGALSLCLCQIIKYILKKQNKTKQKQKWKTPDFPESIFPNWNSGLPQ